MKRLAGAETEQFKSGQTSTHSEHAVRYPRKRSFARLDDSSPYEGLLKLDADDRSSVLVDNLPRPMEWSAR